MTHRFHSLLDLTTEKIIWSVRVRAQAVWKGVNRRTNEFRGFNIILIDDQVRNKINFNSKFIIFNYHSINVFIPLLQSCRIHAFISEKISNRFEAELKEGNAYRLSNFKVLKYNGDEKNRCVRNELHIYFDNQTELKLLTENVGFLKQYAFDLYSLKDVPNFLSENNCFLIGNFFILQNLVHIGTNGIRLLSFILIFGSTNDLCC